MATEIVGVCKGTQAYAHQPVPQLYLLICMAVTDIMKLTAATSSHIKRREMRHGPDVPRS